MRPDIQTTMLNIAEVLARRATCRKLQVGAVLTDAKWRILATGYNGVPRDMPHCTDLPCVGAHAPKGADLCQAVHAEQNALMQCADVERIHALFTTHAPCMRCVKMMMNTPCGVVVFRNGNNVEPEAQKLWLLSGRLWIQG